MPKKPAYLSQTAEWQLDEILEFITKKWSIKVRNEFIQKLQLAITQIEIHPKGCPVVPERKNVRKMLVTEQTSFYFMENTKDIDIIAVFDNRKDPAAVLKIIQGRLKK